MLIFQHKSKYFHVCRLYYLDDGFPELIFCWIDAATLNELLWMPDAFVPCE